MTVSALILLGALLSPPASAPDLAPAPDIALAPAPDPDIALAPAPDPDIALAPAPDPATGPGSALDADDPARLARARLHASLAQGPAWNPNRIALIAPFSGPYKQVGDRLLEAVWLAAATRGADVLVLDSEGDPEIAAAQLKRVALDEATAGVIGPVGQRSARRAAKVAGHLGVTTITLSSAAQAPAVHPFAIRHRLSYAAEAARLGRHAVEAMALTRLAILYPDTTSGRARMAAFWQAVEDAGGEIRGAEAYSVRDEKFDEPIQKLIGRHRDQKGRVNGRWRRLNRKGKGRAMKVRPRVDFDGLFIADGGRRARVILPFLSHWDIPLVSGMFPAASPLRRAPVWVFATRELAPLADRLGRPGLAVRFLTTYTPDSEPAADFTAAFQAAYNDVPTEIAAHGYDATVQLLSRAQTVDGHRALARAMRDPWDGIFGRCAVDAQGDAQCEVRIMGAEPGVGMVELGRLD
ncbi:MAG: ABC-type branched-subunit amino acid transport system substrate-binding protein [Bradymonadia bacterium]